MLVKLLSADKKIVLVDQDVIKQMMTIQTMMDCPLVEESEDDDESKEDDDDIPKVAVNGEVLEKLVGWTKYHLENKDKSDYKAWSHQFFMDNLENIFMFEEGAKFLGLLSYLDSNDTFMDENFQALSNTEAMRNISYDRLGLLISRDTLDVPTEQVVVETL